MKEFRTSPDSKQGYDEFAKRFPPGAVWPSTVLVGAPGGTASDADVATVVKTLQAVDGVFAVFPAPEPRSEDKRIARLGLVLDEDPLKPEALDRIDPLREAASASAAACGSRSATALRASTTRAWPPSATCW